MTRVYLLLKEGLLRIWKTGGLGLKVEQGWVNLPGYGAYHLDPHKFVRRPYRPLWQFFFPFVVFIPPLWKLRTEEWAVFFLEGNPEPLDLAGKETGSENRTAWKIQALRDARAVRQLLAVQPNWIVLVLVLSVLVNGVMAVGLAVK